MSKSVILSLLAQGNTATEILTILDMLVESIVEENIDDVAGYYAALQIATVCPLLDTGGQQCYTQCWGQCLWGVGWAFMAALRI